MYFSALCIKEYGDRSYPELYPQIDEKGHFIPEPGDNSASSAVFTNLLVKQGPNLIFESEHGLDGKLFLTDSRIVLMCDDYESGGALWIGNPVIMAIAGVASSAMAKSRTAGKVLTGQIRYEWIEEVVPTSEKLLLNLVDETIVIKYRDPFSAPWSLAISLKGIKGIAHKIDAEIQRRRDQHDQDHILEQRAPIPLPAARSTESPDHRYCTQCGKELKSSDKFCRRCGAQQAGAK